MGLRSPRPGYDQVPPKLPSQTLKTLKTLTVTLQALKTPLSNSQSPHTDKRSSSNFQKGEQAQPCQYYISVLPIALPQAFQRPGERFPILFDGLLLCHHMAPYQADNEVLKLAVNSLQFHNCHTIRLVRKKKH